MAPRQFFRNAKEGDVSVEGRKANGMNLDANGNVFLYSSANEEYLQSLTDQQYLGNINLDGMKNSIIALTNNNSTPAFPEGNNNNETYFDNQQTDPNKITIPDPSKGKLTGLYVRLQDLSPTSKKVINDNKNNNVLIVIREKLNFDELDPKSKDRTKDGRTEGTLWYKGQVIGFICEDLVREKGQKISNKTAAPAGEYNITLSPSQKNRLASLFGVDFGQIFRFPKKESNPFGGLVTQSSSEFNSLAYKVPSGYPKNLESWVKEKNLGFTSNQIKLVNFGESVTKTQISQTVGRSLFNIVERDIGGGGEVIEGIDPYTGLPWQPPIVDVNLMPFLLMAKLGTDNESINTYIDATYGTYGKAVPKGKGSKFLEGIAFHGGWDEDSSSGCLIYSPIRYNDGTVSKYPDYNTEFNKNLVRRIFNDAIRKCYIVNEFEYNNNLKNTERYLFVTDPTALDRFGPTANFYEEETLLTEAQRSQKTPSKEQQLLQQSNNIPAWREKAKKEDPLNLIPAPKLK